MKRPALFLDRDGVVNVDHGYVHNSGNFQFIDGVFELVVAANRSGYLVIVVTNQAGIGRGYYTEKDFHVLMDWMKTQFVHRGAKIDAVYFCPYHHEHGIGEYKKKSKLRKPAPGMLLQAAEDLDVDLSRSIMLGDKPSDMDAGRAAGVPTLLYFGESGCNVFASPVQSLFEVLPYLSAGLEQAD